MCKYYVVFYENRVTGFIGVVGFADCVSECEDLVKLHYTDERLNYDYHIVPNFPNVMHKFNYCDDFVNIRLIYDKLLINQCKNVAFCLSMFDYAVFKGSWKKAKCHFGRVLSYCKDTSIFENYDFGF